MYLVIIAWIYVVLMMSVAEATNMNGTVLGAVVTFVLYGVGPAALVAYLMGTPARNRANKRRMAEELAAFQTAAPSTEPPSTEPPSSQPDAGSHPARDAAISPMRKEP